MKKVLFAAVTAILAFTGCETSDPQVGGDGVLTISVDKTSIEADGKDIATFTITDSQGNVLTTEENKGTIFFKNVADGTRLPRYSTGLTSIVDGEFEFVGIVNGVETANSVKVKVQNRAKYERFHRNVAIFKLTGTWCSNCPRMTSALHSLGDDAADHSIILACHNEMSAGHPFYVSYKGTDLASSVFLHMGESSASYPTNCYDMVSLSASSSTITISDQIMERRIDSPAAVGIKVSSFTLEGTTLKVDATVMASAEGTYDMVCTLVGDGLKYEGGYTDNDESLYNDVVLAVSGDNFLSYGSKTMFDLAVDAEYSRSFEFSFASTPSADLLKNLHAVILVHKKNSNGRSEVNNCVECAYGETVDYRYN